MDLDLDLDQDLDLDLGGDLEIDNVAKEKSLNKPIGEVVL